MDFLYRLFCPKGFFFIICLLSQCILYWIEFQNIYTFTYQKTLLNTLLRLFLKLSKALSVSLKLYLENMSHQKIYTFWYYTVNDGVILLRISKLNDSALEKKTRRPDSLFSKKDSKKANFYSKSETVEDCHEMRNSYAFEFRTFFLKFYIFEVGAFYLTLPWSIQSKFFSGSLNL